MRKFNLLLMLLFFSLSAPAAVQCQGVAIEDGDTLALPPQHKNAAQSSTKQTRPKKGSPF